MSLPSNTDLKKALHSTFTIESDINVSLQLNEVNISSTQDARVFDNISLIFHCSEAFAQGTYNLSHHELGSHLLLLVPVGHQDKHYLYEALINREAA